MTDRDDYLKAYAEYARVLRTWFVAYGIGGPVLLFTNEAAVVTIRASGEAPGLAALFLVGVSLQVLLAGLNKFSMWGLYFGESSNTFQSTNRYKLAYWLSEQLWIDLVVDALTFALFAVATWKAYQAIAT